MWHAENLGKFKMWKLSVVLFVYFVGEGVDRLLFAIFMHWIDSCLQSRQLYNVCVGGTNKSETEINAKITKSWRWIDFGNKWDLLSELSAHKEKVKRLSVSERRRETTQMMTVIRVGRWYRLGVKISLWSSITFKNELTVPGKEVHNL